MHIACIVCICFESNKDDVNKLFVSDVYNGEVQWKRNPEDYQGELILSGFINLLKPVCKPKILSSKIKKNTRNQITSWNQWFSSRPWNYTSCSIQTKNLLAFALATKLVEKLKQDIEK